MFTIYSWRKAERVKLTDSKKREVLGDGHRVEKVIDFDEGDVSTEDGAKIGDVEDVIMVELILGVVISISASRFGGFEVVGSLDVVGSEGVRRPENETASGLTDFGVDFGSLAFRDGGGDDLLVRGGEGRVKVLREVESWENKSLNLVGEAFHDVEDVEVGRVVEEGVGVDLILLLFGAVEDDDGGVIVGAGVVV